MPAGSLFSPYTPALHGGLFLASKCLLPFVLFSVHIMQRYSDYCRLPNIFIFILVLLRLLRSKVTKNNRWLLQLAREKIFVGLSELLYSSSDRPTRIRQHRLV